MFTCNWQIHDCETFWCRKNYCIEVQTHVGFDEQISHKRQSRWVNFLLAFFQPIEKFLLGSGESVQKRFKRIKKRVESVQIIESSMILSQ